MTVDEHDRLWAEDADYRRFVGLYNMMLVNGGGGGWDDATRARWECLLAKYRWTLR